MKSRFLRSGSPGVRLGRALLTSLVLHSTILFPYKSFESRSAPPDLTVMLPPLPPASLESGRTETSPELLPEPQPAELPTSALPPKPAVPQVLSGQALNTALTKMTREEFYPREAIALGLEGQVVLLLLLTENSVVTSVEVAHSSGHRILDEAAVKAAGRIGSVASRQRQVLLPVNFRLE